MTSRRDFIKKTAYAAPAIMTLTAQPSFAGKGSKHEHHDGEKRKRKKRRRRWRDWLGW